MAFTRPIKQEPTAIARLTVTLTDTLTPGDNTTAYTARYDLLIVDQYGRRMDFPGGSGDLVPHLTTQEIQALMSFMVKLRGKAEAEIIEEDAEKEGASQ